MSRPISLAQNLYNKNHLCLMRSKVICEISAKEWKRRLIKFTLETFNVKSMGISPNNRLWFKVAEEKPE